MPSPIPGKLHVLLYCPYFRPQFGASQRVEHRGSDPSDYWISDRALNAQLGLPEKAAVYHGGPIEVDLYNRLIENEAWRDTACRSLGLASMARAERRACLIARLVRVPTKTKSAADAAAQRREMAEQDAA